MARLCTKLQESTCGRRFICVDQLEEENLYQIINEDDAVRKCWLKVVQVALEGYHIHELYEKVQYDVQKAFSLMRLYNGNKCDYIYCIEQVDASGNTFIIMIGFLKGSIVGRIKVADLRNITQVETYEYKIL